MKALLIKSVLYFLLITMLSSGCNKDFSITSASEKKIQGQWKYEKVKFQKNFSFSNKDLTGNYENLIIEFNSNHKLIQTNFTTNAQQTGTWSMNGNYMYYGESSQYTEELTGTLNGESFDWNYIDVNNKKITAHESRDGGTYKYTLIKY